MKDIEERLYEQAANEIQDSTTKPGLWAKAFSDSMGDLERTKALYIRLRVKQLIQREDQPTIPEVSNGAAKQDEKILQVMRRLSIDFRAKSGSAPSFSHFFPPDSDVGIVLDTPVDMVLTEKRVMFFPGIQMHRHSKTAEVTGFFLGGPIGLHLAAGLMEKLVARKEKAYDALFLNEATQSGEFPFFELKDLICEIFEFRYSWDMFGGSKNAYAILIGNLHYRGNVTTGLAQITFTNTSANKIPIRKSLEDAGVVVSLLEKKFKKSTDVIYYLHGRLTDA